MTQKRIVQCAALLLVTALLTLGGCLIINGETRSLSSCSAVPEEIEQKNYIISELQPDASGQMTLCLTDAPENLSLAFVINDMGSFIPNLRISLNGKEIYSYGKEERFQRTHIVPLPLEMIKETGQIELTLVSTGWEGRSKEILTGRTSVSPSMILCSYDNAIQLIRETDRTMYVLIGIYLIMICTGVVIFTGRTQESGYLFLTVLCVIRFVNTAIDSSLLPLSMGQYYSLRHILVVLPVVFNVSVAVWLLRPEMGRMRNRSLLISGLLTVGSALLQCSGGNNWYHLFQAAAFLFFGFHCFKAAARGQTGWPLLCAGFTMGYTIVAFIYLVNVWKMFPSGQRMICTNFTNFSYIPGMVVSIVYISRELVSQFNETEHLSMELAKTNSELDRRVEQKTAQLVAEQKSRQDMMLNIVHDLRSPVFVLKGCLEGFRPADEEQKNRLKTMAARLGVMEALINDLFLSEKLEAGRVTLYRDNVQLDLLLGEIVNGLEATGGKKIHAQLEPAVVWGDETRLFQAFQNLAENARNYTPEGGTIGISVRLDPGGQQAEVRISDDGPGMDPEECRAVFERYYTGKRAARYASSGLGLNIASELIHLHGGTIRMESGIGAGTSAVVTLPTIAPEDLEGVENDSRSLGGR